MYLPDEYKLRKNLFCLKGNPRCALLTLKIPDHLLTFMQENNR